MPSPHAALAYARAGHDSTRELLETAFFARVVPRLVAGAGGGEVLDLGCGDGLAARLAGPALTRYAGVDFREPGEDLPGDLMAHDLRAGLGPVGPAPFDLYLATFGVASHLRPGELRRLLREVAAHARPGSLVALEALGAGSLEWPRLWSSHPGPGRTISYRLGADVEVHPWWPAELAALYEQAGVRPLRALDRTLQAGPKAGEGRYWPGLPPLRQAMNALLEGRGAKPSDGPSTLGSSPLAIRAVARSETAGARAALTRALPPLPAGRAAALHHSLAARRHRLVEAHGDDPAALARAIWSLEPRSGGGFGHGLLLVGRVE